MGTLAEGVKFFQAGDFTAAQAKDNAKKLKESVKAAIDPLAVIKDNVADTFGDALEREVDNYFFYLKNNPKEEARFARQTAQREALLAKGKKVDWKVIPKVVMDLDELKGNILKAITYLENSYTAYIEKADSVDFAQRSVAIIACLKA